jgi:hypothetical protein
MRAISATVRIAKTTLHAYNVLEVEENKRSQMVLPALGHPKNTRVAWDAGYQHLSKDRQEYTACLQCPKKSRKKNFSYMTEVEEKKLQLHEYTYA